MKLKIKHKLLGGFGLILIIMIASGLVSNTLINRVDEVNSEAREAMEQEVYFEQVSAAHNEWMEKLSYVFTMDREFKGETDPEQCMLGTWYYDFIDSEEFNELPSDMRSTLRELEEPHRNLHQSAIRVNELINQPGAGEEERQQALQIYENQAVANAQVLGEAFDELGNYYAQQHEALTQRAETMQQTASTIQTVTLPIVVVLGLLIAVIIFRSISRPINTVTERLHDMAEKGGDLTQRVEVNTRDELADLAHWFNQFVDKLRDILIKVREASDSVSTAASEISSGNQDLSQRTEEQASSLEEISSTIEEMTSSLQQSADNANEADRISRATHEKVKKGEEVVSNMQNAMEDITKSSREIAEIITKVNDIAFQTNLLALNAAVEAARAGEQGRGFAVVAAEVRNLAGRVAESAKDIENLINNSIQNVDHGNEFMKQSCFAGCYAAGNGRF